MHKTMQFFKDETARETEDPMEEVFRKNKRSRRFNLILFVVLFAGVAIYSLVGGRNAVTAVIDEERFGVTALDDTEVTLAYADVAALELREPTSALDRGTLVSGEERSNCCSGEFENDEFGRYRLHVNLGVEPYIVAKTAAGEVLVFNAESPEITEQIFAEIEKRIP